MVDEGSARHGLDEAGDWITNQLLSRSGVEERKSRFGNKEALFLRGTEFFHLDAPGLADVRLGRKAIRAHRDEPAADAHSRYVSGAI